MWSHCLARQHDCVSLARRYKCGAELTQCTYSTADCADGSELDCVPATALPKLDACTAKGAISYKVTC